MTPPPFDLQRLFRATDAERERRGLTWAALAGQVGVAATTIRRLRDAEDAEADGVLALVRWLGDAPEDFVNSAPVGGVRLPGPGTGYIRVDMELVARAMGDPRGARGRRRTSIQNLTRAALLSARPIASLTRFSEE